MSKIVLDVEQDSNIYSLDNVLGHLLESYSRFLPQNIYEEFEKLIDMLDNEVYRDIPNGDINPTTLYESMTIETYDEEYIPTYPKERISIYDLISMEKNGIPLPNRVKIFLPQGEYIYQKYCDDDGGFMDYEIEDKKQQNDSRSIGQYLSECLLQHDFTKKCIEILDTTN